MSEYNEALRHRTFLAFFNALLLIASLGVIVFLVLRVPSIENQAVLSIISVVTGSFVREHGAAYGWWFGSSKRTIDNTNEKLNGDN